MKKFITSFVMTLIAIMFVQNSYAQLTGTKTIPGTYATIAAAIADLNSQGVGSGGVIFNISSGYTETITASLNVTASGTLSNPIIFQKSGSGANPLITAYVGTATPSSAAPDGIWNFQGSDYVTIDGVDLIDMNTTNPETMEYGYGLFKNTVTDGCQNITIRNCVITLNRVNNASGTAPMVEGSVGILVINSTPTAATTALVPTDISGTNSYNKFYSNIVQNCNYGIVLYGYADVTPFTLGDTGNDIGGSSLSSGNNILNFGGGGSTNPAAGIRAVNQWGINISYNTINNNNGSGVNHATTLRGIFAQSGTSASANINYNNVTINGGATTSSIYGIDNGIGSTAASNTININNNTITGSYTTATSGIFYGINNSSTAATLNIISNTVSRISSPGTGALYGINCGSPGVLNVNNNSIKSLNKTGKALIYAINITTPFTSSNAQNNTIDSISNTAAANTSTIAGIYSPSTALIENYSNNIFSNFSSTGTATIYAIRIGSANGNKTLQNNQIYNFSITGAGSLYGISLGYGSADYISGNTIYNFLTTGTTTGGTLYGIYVTAGTTNAIYNNKVYGFSHSAATTTSAAYGVYVSSGTTNNIYKNKIYDLSATTSASPTIYGVYITGGTTNNIYNNYIGDLRVPASSNAITLAGIYLSGGTTDNLYYNTIYLAGTSTGTLFGSSCVYASTTPIVDMRNNVLTNLTTPVGATGFATAYRRSSTTLTTYASTSNNNDFYAGTPGTNNLIFYDGTNSYQTITTYKDLVAPRDNFSISENPNFLSTVSSDVNYLHLNPSIASQLETGGVVVTSPSITDDFDGEARYPNTGYPFNPSYPPIAPDIGADEFGGISLDLNPPIINYTPLLNTPNTTSRTLTATITDASGVPISGLGLPVLYWKINSGSFASATATSLGSNQYSFTFGTGVQIGDVVSYYICAQDNATPPNVGSSPSLGASGFTANPPAASTPPTTPSSYTISASSLSGDYTVGLTTFNKIAGKNITFEKVVKKVMKEVILEEPLSNKMPAKGEKITDATSTSSSVQGKKVMREVEEISWIPMENGKVYDGPLYIKKSESPNYAYPENINGIYGTITAAIADLNLRGVSGATRFLLTDTSYSTETFPITVNISNENLTSPTKTVTIKPNVGVTSKISGAAASSQIFKILNNYITIDGSNTSSGTTRDFTIQNTSVTAPQVVVFGSTGTTPIVGSGLKNCIAINGANTSSAIVISDGATPGNAGYFNNITIQNNSVNLAYMAFYCNAVIATGNGNGLNIIGNDLNSVASPIRLVGVYLQGVDGATVSNNNIGNDSNTTDANNISGIWFATGTVNSTISGNTISNIYGSSGGPRGLAISSGAMNSNINITGNTISGLRTASSTPPYGMYIFSTTTGVSIKKNNISTILNSNTGGYGARGINVITNLASSNIDIINNFVSDVKCTGDALTTYWGVGIGIDGNTGGVNVYFNSVNLFGTYPGYNSATISTAFYVASTVTSINTRDNIFVNSFDNTTVTTDKSYSINSQAANTAFTDINYNDYYASGSSGVLGYLGTDKTTLAAWQAATGKDLNSVSGYPMFLSDSNLHIDITQPSPAGNAGQFIATITDDIDGNPRNTSTPDIGGDEFISTVSAPTLLSPLNNTIDLPTNLTFIWSKSTESKKNEIGKNSLKSISNYWFEYSTDQTFATSIIDSTLTDTTKFITGLSTNTKYYWKVKAKNQTGWGTFSAVWNFTTAPNVPNVPILLVPVNSAINQPYTNLNFAWSRAIETLVKNINQNIGTKGSPLTISKYWFELSTDSLFATVMVRDSSLTDTTKTVATLSSNVSYYWRVKAKNQTGWGGFSDRFTFKTTLDPTYLSQANFTSILTPQYMVSGTSTRLPIVVRATVSNLVPNKLYKYYTLGTVYSDLGTSSSGAGILLLINKDSTKFRYYSTGNLTSSCDIFRADASGNYTGWFAFLNSGNARFASGKYIMPAITIGDSTGTLISRLALNDSIKVMSFSTTAADSSVTGIWGTSVGFPMNMVTLYDNIAGTGKPIAQTFLENDSAAMSSLVPFYSTNVEGQNGRWGSLIPNLNSNGIKRIEQRAKTTGNILTFNTSATGVWTSGVNTVNPTGGTTPVVMQLVDAPLLNFTTLISPANNSTGNPINLNLVWTKSQYASVYNVVLATDSLFTNVVLNDSTMTDSVKALTNLTPLTNYYWKVRAGNTTGWNVFSSIYSFKIIGSPMQVVLSSPANNSVNQPVNITFKWFKTIDQTMMAKNEGGKNTTIEKGEPLTVTNYWFEYGTDSTFATVITRDSLLTDTTKSISGLNNNTKYYWRVKAKNQIGWNVFSSVWNFTTIAGIPIAPVLSTPANGATGVSVTPVMSWNASQYATSYRLQVASDSAFTTLKWDTSGVTILNATVPTGKLTYGTKYYWRVNASNLNGTSPYSAMWNFTTITRPSLALKVFLEGFYNSTTGTQVSDTINVYLADSTQSYALVDSAKIVLNDTGKVSLPMSRITSGKYFIIIKHRNHLETWSKYAVNFALGNATSYDFTTAATQAYGNNMKQVGSVWVLYGGDANRDGEISGLDVAIFVVQFGTQGYLAADFNGDGDVTGTDATILVANFGITRIIPTFDIVTGNPEVIKKKREEIQKQINDKIQEKKNQQWFDKNQEKRNSSDGKNKTTNKN